MIMTRLGEVLVREKLDIVAVPCDTNSALVSALTVIKIGTPVAHVEVGAKSYNMRVLEEITLFNKIFVAGFPYFSMNILSLLSSDVACSKLFRRVRWASGVYCPRCGSMSVKSHGNYGRGLKRYFCKACRRTFNDKTGTPLHYSRLREWFTLILLFLGLHNSCHGLSWLLGRSPMTVFKALKRLMLRLRDKTRRVEFRGAVEVDELYVNAGLKV